MWTSRELQEIADAIKNLHIATAIQYFGVEATGITVDLYDALVADGLVEPDDVENFALTAYKSGYLNQWEQSQGDEGGIDDEDSLDEKFQAAIDAGMEPLTDTEVSAIEYSAKRAAQYIVGLGNRVATDSTTLAIETEDELRQQRKAQVAEVLTDSQIKRLTIQQTAGRIGDAIQGWTRDLLRIASTELEDAYQHGYADQAKKIYGDDVKVAKLPAPDACDTCKQLFLETDGTPKIFSLSQLEANGTNVGKSRSEWLPVTGPAHPFCHCQLVSVPPGFGFNDEGQLVPVEG